jgi:glucose/arabinose dehydrogenase
MSHLVAKCGMISAAMLCVPPGAQAQLEDPIPAPIRKTGAAIRLVEVASGLTAPNWGISAPGHPDRLFVTDQDGTLWNINLETGDKTVFLDVSARLVSLGVAGPGSFDERGLLGVAFHPDYESNGLVYTFTSEPIGNPPDFTTIPIGETANCQSVIIEWEVPEPGDPDSVVDLASARVLLRIDKPQFNHNGGAINFGPDGMLYIATGDGGAADDQGLGHSEQGNGQDLSNPLGKFLRIDPLGTNSANGQYGIPADNPFVGGEGLPAIVEEIYAYGFRNPFRFSFDSLTGQLLTGDVGQNDIEEVDIVVAGGNYGWRIKEGTFLFDANGDENGFVIANSPGQPADLIDPIAQYDHDEGLAIIGGFVYRGSAIPFLRGKYVFGEFAQNFSNDGRLFFLQGSTVREFRMVGPDALGLSLLGMGQDAAGELYVLANATGVPFGDTGVVLRIERGSGP